MTQTRLKKDALSFWEVVSQSIANIAPSATPALIIPLVFASSGNGTWLAYAVATVAMLFVTAQINAFASRSASPGALSTFTTLGLGARWGGTFGLVVVSGLYFHRSCVPGGIYELRGRYLGLAL